MNIPTARSIARSDLISLASTSFSAGILLMVAMLYLTKGNPLAWIFAGTAIVMGGAAFVIGRKTLSKFP